MNGKDTTGEMLMMNGWTISEDTRGKLMVMTYLLVNLFFPCGVTKCTIDSDVLFIET
jgi:hypothetical protein